MDVIVRPKLATGFFRETTNSMKPHIVDAANNSLLMINGRGERIRTSDPLVPNLQAFTTATTKMTPIR